MMPDKPLLSQLIEGLRCLPGVGPKSASALLGHFGDLESLFERIDEVPFLSIRGAKSLQKKLLDHRPAAELARKLTVIETAVESALASPALAREKVNEPELNRLFDELAFGGMLRHRCLRV